MAFLFIFSAQLFAQQPATLKNSLGMTFIPLGDSGVSLCLWETRVADWSAHLKARSASEWPHRPAFAQGDDHPIVNVTRGEAAEFCLWLTEAERASGRITNEQRFRLPTSAEWDYATGIEARSGGEVTARKDDDARFTWGAEWPPLRQSANVNSAFISGGKDDGFKHTAPVGQFAPSRLGIFDLGGNVWEWTLNEGDTTDKGSLRGGSWMQWRPETLRAGFQMTLRADVRAPSIGFRCAFEDSTIVQRQRSLAISSKLARETAVLARREVSQEDIDRVTAAAKERTTVEMTTAPQEKASAGDISRVIESITGTAPAAQKPQPQR